ncbi:methyltransferase domain-containing protein [Phyllobacterium salinisoli]|uniref:Methyltransferase domain-containing protein n=1 Tax=Phyllobacterium salinisoli TaxID=1899321 RepID=A0A368K647_9HYPH|nr:methyltransferase domain-containing protein [Phyllobacterium salinisoli]RCS24701.1 methyltransferase domain-containing protein [Phyllobacterium salinisoli]
MTRAILSSGDLIADRRAHYAEMMFEAGDHASAADVMRQALEIVPGWAPGLFRLGEMEEKAGHLDAAADAWRNVLKADAEDRFGASLKLASLGVTAQPDAPPSAYVETLFDAYAPTFETALVEKLDYRVPELLAEAIVRAGGSRHYRHAIDLGCGTGLMGERLRASVSFLQGIDLSEAMLRKAEEKRIYDRLEKGDVNELEKPEIPADLVVAADVFVYVGNLDRAFANIAEALEPGGLFAFSVETHETDGPSEEELLLQPSLRFTHSAAYVIGLLTRHGFTPLEMNKATIRHDRGEPLTGIVVVARRTG